VERLEQAGGSITERWALCQTMPREEFDETARELVLSGYRLNCLRPFEASDKVLVAAVWHRDGREAYWEFDLTRDEVQLRDVEHRQAGRLPIDVATSRAVLSEPGEEPLFSVLWVGAASELVDARMYLAVSEGEHAGAWMPLNERQYVPFTNLLHLRNGERLYSSLRFKLTKNFEYDDCWFESGPATIDRVPADWSQADLRATVVSESEVAYSSTWWDHGGWSTSVLRDLTPDDLLERGAELERKNGRPYTISVRCRPDNRSLVSAAVWRHPEADDAARSRFARAQANAALALFHIGEPGSLWPLLKFRTDPTCRSWLIHSLARCGLESDALWNRLRVESDPSSRRALLQALVQFAQAPEASDPEPADLEMVEKLYERDTDPGVHSAAGQLLRVCRREAPPPVREPPPGALWSQTSQGHTLAHVTGPVQFLIGSSTYETQHESRVERKHQVRIPRSFAIGTSEVTVEQFLRFRPDFDYPRDYLPVVACPITSMNYYEILKYCRWLSEKERIAEDQMCYPPMDQIGPGMMIPADCLERTGYRLPTEAEWEFGCRAGTSSPRPYGYGDELLPYYAWTAQNSQYRARPVAQLLPNDLGLFDVLGNAMEYCLNTHRPYPRLPPSQVRVDELEPAAFFSRLSREWRGGAFLYQPIDARSAHRDDGVPDSSFPFQGFRIARTLPR
jgi:formylglycine-generating enzyme required for sulfatase activity